MPETPLQANSALEAIHYVHVSVCPTCRTGQLDAGQPGFDRATGEMKVVALCMNCGASHLHRFQLTSAVPALDPVSNPGAVNPSGEPSGLIDVVQWVTLSAQLLEAAEATPDRQEARWRKHRAAECLDEALKFYGPGEELPPAAACFAAGSLDRLRAHPDRFMRQRLVGLRNRLPSISASDRVLESIPEKPWWRLWS